MGSMPNAPTEPVALTGQVLLYDKPELLSKDAHAKLGVDIAPTRFTFAAKTHVVPLTVPEFGPASLSFPIIFAGDQFYPMAVFGLREGENLFADETTGFEFDAYVPCYVRRYPFVLASTDAASANGQGDQMLVGIDRGYPYLREGGEFQLFEENGEPSQYTKNCIQFCNDFETQNRMTQSFVQLLRDNDLLEPRTVEYQPRNPDGSAVGGPQKVAEFTAVSEAKLNALPAEKLVELRGNGALAQIYAHLNSLFNWERLIVKQMARTQAQQPQAANA